MIYTKAYDVPEFLEQLKTEVPTISEAAAKAVLKHVFPWLQESSALSENKVDDLFSIAYPLIQGQLEALVEKIDA